MERGDRAPVATLYARELSEASTEVSLGGSAAHHAAVRRLSPGETVRLTNGAGVVGLATITSLRKGDMLVELRHSEQVAPLPWLEVLAPVADRDRMLWLAEKCAELGVTVWQPVIFSRSRGVVPRGEGEAFAAKVHARMVGALEQSGGAWLPMIRRELPIEKALAGVTATQRLALDRAGRRIDPIDAAAATAVIFGPEGGIEPDEHALLDALGWRRVALGPTTLRFETAGIAAVAIVRAGVPSMNAEG